MPCEFLTYDVCNPAQRGQPPFYMLIVGKAIGHADVNFSHTMRAVLHRAFREEIIT